MRKTVKTIGKKSFICAALLDAAGIIFSSLINTSLTKTVLNRIILFCYCIRFELIALLLVLSFLFIVYYIVKNRLYAPWQIVCLAFPFILCYCSSQGNILNVEIDYSDDDDYGYYGYYGSFDYSDYKIDNSYLYDEIEDDSVITKMSDEYNQESFDYDSIDRDMTDEDVSVYSDNDDQYYTEDTHENENPFIRFFVARYYYFNNNFYEIESQDIFVKKAIKFQKERNWDQCIRYYNLAKSMYPQANNVERIENIIEKCEIVKSYCRELHKRYIAPADVSNNLSLNTFVCSRTLSKIWPNRYSKQYEKLKKDVSLAINKYEDLYLSCNQNDYRSCKKLISEYGWCWFDHEFLRMLSNPNNDANTIVRWLKEYIQNEDVIIAQSRLHRTWFSNEYLDY